MCFKFLNQSHRLRVGLLLLVMIFETKKNKILINFYFQIKKDKILGEGNFGRVCLATVSKDPIPSQINTSDNQLNDLSPGERIRKRFSIKRNQNTYAVSKSNDQELNDLSKPLIDFSNLPKNSRLAACKICKGK